MTAPLDAAASPFAAAPARKPGHADIRDQDLGALPESASSASCAEENELKAMPSRLSAFSITQRMERSSSTIQTGFMLSQQILNVVRPDGLELDDALVILDERLRERESQAATAFPPDTSGLKIRSWISSGTPGRRRLPAILVPACSAVAEP